jgi:hypothetical protein
VAERVRRRLARGSGWRSGQAELLQAPEGVFQRPGVGDLAVAEPEDGDLIDPLEAATGRGLAQPLAQRELLATVDAVRTSGPVAEGALVGQPASPGRAAAAVTDGGTLAAHASLVTREYGIPAVVATGDATTRLSDGRRVTVDGGAGTVHLHN